ncbi:MAG: NUDIX hydrolase [Chloroflexi bacterium]|nr:NUDIX hydrolase [Chloroflexota bacterium]
MKREYPDRPLVGVGGVVVRDDGCVLLVQRGQDPGKGRWGLPGGLVELGETLAEALRREVGEECGIEIEPGEVVGIIEPRVRDEQGRLRFHYVVIDLLATYRSGQLQATSDVSDARWVHPDELSAYPLSTPQTLSMIRKALSMAARISTN